MKSEKQKTKWIGLAILGLILIFSIPSYKLIPFGTPDGLDFHNIYSYSKCTETINLKFENNIYHAHGADCKDAMNRPFVYPPLLYYSTLWVSHFDTFESARLAWRLFIVLGLLWSIYIWLGTINNFLRVLPFTLLLFFQFPMIFALERGNNDILVILTWTFSYYFFKKGRDTISGLFAVMSVLMKVYPLFAIIIPILGFVVSREYLRLKKYLIGVLTGGIVIYISFNWLWYSFFQIIKEFSGHRMVFGVINHSVQYLSSNKLVNTLTFVTILATWVYRYRFDRRQSAVTLSGALAISTFYSATSFDYNLITTYPLILILISGQIETFNFKKFLILLGLVIGLFGNRYMFIWGNDYGYKFRLIIQIVSFVLVAIEVFPLFYLKNIILYNFKKVKLYVTN